MRILGWVLALGLITSPAAADIGTPVKIASPTSASPSYRFFEARSHGVNPRAYWNPCRTIRYGIDFRAATRHGLTKSSERERWQSAIAEVSQASGLRFKYVGQIVTHPAGGQPARVKGVDIPITFATAKNYRAALRGASAGEAGVHWRPSGNGRKQINSGYVVMDAQDIVLHTTSWQSAPDSRPASDRPADALRALYMHEFGHALGLEHVQDNGQIMFPTISASRPDSLGEGDLQGLRKLGSQRCF